MYVIMLKGSDDMKHLALKINKKFYYGWLIVVIAALSAFFSSPGQTYSISVFNAVYEHELGYSKTLLSTGYSVATIISGLVIVFMGKAIDKFGQKKMYVVVTIMLAFATFFSSYVMNIWMIYVSFFLLRFFGQGSMTIIPSSLVPQWFDKRRGFAISLMTLGSFLGTLFVPILNIWLIKTFEWEFAWRIWGISLLVILLPLVIILVVNRPEDIGLNIENEVNHLSQADLLKALDQASWTLSEAMHTKVFWYIGLMSMIVPMFTTGVTFHFYSLMGEKGVSNETAAWIIGLIAFPIIIMPIISKTIIDKTKPKHIFVITQSMILFSMVILLLWVTNAASALAFILFYGLSTAIQSITLNVVWPTYYGRKYLGSIRGMTTVFMVIGSALGPLFFGLSYDQFGSFNYAIVAMMVMGMIGIILALLTKKPLRANIA